MVTFIINDLNFLVATIVYTIISFITAVITWLICKIIRHCNNNNDNSIDTKFAATIENNNNNNLTFNTLNDDPRINVIPHAQYRNCRTK